jgi:hypothetical protein
VTDIVPFYTAGHQAFDFNGTNGHATTATGTTGQPPATTGMLIEAWVRMDSSQSTSPTIMGNSIMILQQFSGRFYVKIGSAAAAGNIAKTVGTVYHILVAWSGGASGTTNWTLYINGVNSATGSVSVTSTTPTYSTIGGHWNGTIPFDGVVSRFAVYSGSGVYADAARLALAHYNAGISGVSTGSSQNLNPVGITNATAVNAPSLSLGAVNLNPVGITNATAVNLPTVTRGSISVTPVGITNPTVVNSPSVFAGFSLRPTSIDNPTVVNAPHVSYTQTRTPVGIDNPTAVNPPHVALTTGYISIRPTSIDVPMIVGKPYVTAPFWTLSRLTPSFGPMMNMIVDYPDTTGIEGVVDEGRTRIVVTVPEGLKAKTFNPDYATGVSTPIPGLRAKVD